MQAIRSILGVIIVWVGALRSVLTKINLFDIWDCDAGVRNKLYPSCPRRPFRNWPAFASYYSWRKCTNCTPNLLKLTSFRIEFGTDLPQFASDLTFLESAWVHDMVYRFIYVHSGLGWWWQIGHGLFDSFLIFGNILCNNSCLNFVSSLPLQSISIKLHNILCLDLIAINDIIAFIQWPHLILHLAM